MPYRSWELNSPRRVFQSFISLLTIIIVHGCNQYFPLLVELKLLKLSVVELVLALENLTTNPSLLEAKCGRYDEDEIGDFFVECQQAFGERIKKNEIYHIDNIE